MFLFMLFDVAAIVAAGAIFAVIDSYFTLVVVVVVGGLWVCEA